MSSSTHKGIFTISELAQELDISTRTIRYYEEIGLILPQRSGKGTRYYTRSDRARLKLILRGKRFGFSLHEIKEMITLFDEDRTGRKQLQRTIQYGEEKIRELDARIDELIRLREEILEFKTRFEEKMASLEAVEGNRESKE
ncbi:MAG: MerR family DNA-binding transcriptional regulator [Firmicutes bacterium]|uniref:DNA-binding transcriptional regulator, MerR family n=1 Tax=Melghirimyces thermohalophilus TaxID=1236220 RepID=A0A1G6RHS3_9BACL|nr:MerR family DNA-binding transcriptional regulator [Melghirimyces thermohalophilus]MDA8352557.1 MerR family DNA-binding transcriptional regulator [Bacillota bacterium]SDD03894.1 DNA-binding transcriptional regulator, MerR family [Melghirimyces thermohalophilus]